MTSIKLTLTGASASAEVEGALTSGMVGVPVTICCDSAWDGLIKTLVCRSGTGTQAVVNVQNQTTLPSEALKRSKWGKNDLFLGVEGRRGDGTLVIASTMAFCQKILPGANPGEDPGMDRGNPVWMQILSLIGPLSDLKTSHRDNLVLAINDALGGMGIEKIEIEEIPETASVAEEESSAVSNVDGAAETTGMEG